MVTGELDGKIILEKFELDPEEMNNAKSIVNKYAEKIKRNTEYQQILLEMRTHKKNKNVHFEIKGKVIFDGGMATSEDQNINPFIAIDNVLKKILGEIEHKIRK